MKFTKLSYFIGAVLLMIFHSHTHATSVQDNLVITQSPITQAFFQSTPPQNISFVDIESFEIEDEDNFLKLHGKTISVESYIGNHLIFSHYHLHFKIPTYQLPLLSYKSLPSYLQVFVI